jgi:hypothetical protein
MAEVDESIPIPLTDLRAFWDFEGISVAAESLSGFNDLTFSAVGLRTNDDSFALDSAIRNPDGSSLYASLPSTTSNIFGFSSSFEVFYAVKPTAAGLSGTATILDLNYRSSGWDPDNKGLTFSVKPDLEVSFRIEQGRLDGYNGGLRGEWDTGVFLKPNEWNLVFCSRNNAQSSVHVYNSDGLTEEVLATTLTDLTSWANGFNGVLASAQNSSTPNAFAPPEIILDYMGVYRRTLTSQERQDLWDRVLPEPAVNLSTVSGVVQIDGAPAERTVRAFGYNAVTYMVEGAEVTQSKSLGHATSDPATGEYTIDLLAGYGDPVFVVAFDDYGAPFAPEATLAAGNRIHPTTPNGHVWETTGSGTLPVDEPTWVVDTETSQLYGTASMIARPFYRPMVHGPIMPEVTTPDPAP